VKRQRKKQQQINEEKENQKEKYTTRNLGFVKITEL
jgi:hypothetical protein